MAHLDMEKIKVYDELSKILIKITLVVGSLVSFFIILFFALKAETLVEKTILAFLAVCNSGTLYAIIRHYFPKTIILKKATPDSVV